MKLLVGCLLIALSLPSLEAADKKPLQSVIKAAQKLARATNYSWVSVSTSAPNTRSWRQGPTEGRCKRGGETHVQFTVGENRVELGFLGKQAAIYLDDQWRASSELQDNYAWIAKRLKTYKRPAQEAMFLARHTHNLKRDKDGTFTGELDPAALKFFLSRGRRDFDELPHMSGTARFHLKKGRLQSYAYTVKGRLLLNPDEDPVQVDRTTKVEIKAVGNTEVKLPIEARAKLR